jgi:rhamnogalacturonyl hydrolase YesR
MGAALIRMYKVQKDPRFKVAIDHIADYVTKKQFRLVDGTIARQRPQAQSVWADDAYMSIPFLAEMGSLTGNAKYFDDAVKQALQMSKYLFRQEKGLYDHGVNIHNVNDPNIYWGRANGWLIISIVDLLDVLPENYKGREEILKILRAHVKGLTEVQNRDGFWNNLLDKTDSYGETSCTALFVYGIAHAINQGWVDYTFGPVAQAGWNALATKIMPNGQVDGTCIATTFASENVYYYHRPANEYAPHGYGPVLLAGAEIIKLFQNEKLVIKAANGTFHYRLRSEAGK